MSDLVSRRLLGYPLSSQIRSLQRKRKDDPLQTCNWFRYWETRPDEFRSCYSQLEEEDKTRFRSLQSVFEVVYERPFNLTDVGAMVEATNLREAFSIMSDLVTTIAKKQSNGLMLVGPGGCGKSWTVLETIEDLGLEEGHDFIRIPGYATPAGLYNLLYNNSDKLVVFDDCDSIFKDLTGLNILKSVLDTLPRRIVSWQTSSKLIEEPEFIFTGQIIFISNMDPEKIRDVNMRALLTRVMTLVISATPLDMLMRMIELMPKIAVDLTMDEREEILQFIQENYERFNDFSLRFLVNLVSLRKTHPDDRWKTLALALH